MVRTPPEQKATERGTLTVAALADRFMAEHVEQKRKPATAAFYRHLLEKIIKPELGAIKADKVTRAQVARLHGKLKSDAVPGQPGLGRHRQHVRLRGPQRHCPRGHEPGSPNRAVSGSTAESDS